MQRVHSYACKHYPGMEKCPGRFYAETEGELWKLIEVHASVAHGEDTAAWTPKDRDFLRTLMRIEDGGV